MSRYKTYTYSAYDTTDATLGLADFLNTLPAGERVVSATKDSVSWSPKGTDVLDKTNTKFGYLWTILVEVVTEVSLEDEGLVTTLWQARWALRDYHQKQPGCGLDKLATAVEGAATLIGAAKDVLENRP